MASKRNRIIEIKNYLESCGVTINIGKNKAQGHTGFFKASKNTYRIDIAKGLAEDDILKALAHEFAHFLHYSYDKTLKSLDFVFPNTDEYIEELIKITVENIPKNNAKQLFDIKDNIQNEIQQISLKIKNIYPDFKENKDYSLLEEKIKKTPLKYLLKYDRVKVFNGFVYKIYTLESLKEDTVDELYLKLKSKKRTLNKIKAKINKLNKYYNSPAELFARSFELYITNKTKLKTIAPNVYEKYETIVKNNSNLLILNFIKFYK